MEDEESPALDGGYTKSAMTFEEKREHKNAALKERKKLRRKELMCAMTLGAVPFG